MHTHLSLFEGDRNAFHDASDPLALSKVGRAFIAGLLQHSAEFTAVTNQWVNSYKRLWGGGEAPAYVCWGRNNRSALVRIPMYKPQKGNSTRVEIRSPDSACNPYLTYAVLLAAGLKGIEEGYELPDGAEDDVWALTDAERRAMGIAPLPGSLSDAIATMERSELMAETLGEGVFDFFLRNKRAEWEDYRRRSRRSSSSATCRFCSTRSDGARARRPAHGDRRSRQPRRLAARAAASTCIPTHPYLGNRVPPSVEGDALIVLGGPMSAYDDEVAPWLPSVRDAAAERDRRRRADDRDLPWRSAARGRGRRRGASAVPPGRRSGWARSPCRRRDLLLDAGHRCRSCSGTTTR